MSYVEVILPLPIEQRFTYRIPKGLTPNIGSRVIVPFGKRKVYTGIVYKILEKDDSNFVKKDIIELLDEQPVINNYQLEFIQWVSNYYLCAIGEAYNASLPAGLKLTSESMVSLNPDLDIDDVLFSEKEERVVIWLKEKDLTFQEVSDVAGIKYPYQLIKGLIDKEIITLYEKLKDRYTSKKETKIRINPEYLDALDELAVTLESKAKQYEVLMAYLQEVPVLDQPLLNDAGITKKQLLSNDISNSSLNTLIKNKYFEKWDQSIDRFNYDISEILTLPVLTTIQQKAYKEIIAHFEQNLVALLFGVTGSGKTAIYMQLIKEVLDNKGQVLLLLPEIALTTQIIKRFRNYFGSSFAVYHSRFSDSERVEVYQDLLKGKVSFIIGVRSSLFLPFSNLRLVIVDEEHETSYKQHDPAPRYHARDSAVMLAQFHQANILLGSATPSLESIQNVREGKYGIVTLLDRFGQQPMPEIEIANLKISRKRKEIKGSFTNSLLANIESSLSRQKQVILFHNRRGYSPYIQCMNCANIPQCPNCDVSLTYHIYKNELICHYCGHHYHLDQSCSACNTAELKTVGTGTEKIEEELSLLLPNAKIRRMDLDTPRSKNAYQKIIDDFEVGNIQILIGTQMITKGLDFEHVDLVGVVDADRLVYFPDFRSHERAYQLISQVSGRAGRKHDRGKVIIQTSNPEHPVFEAIINDQTSTFVKTELKERFAFHYPPFTRMITITIKSKKVEDTWEAAREYYKWLSKGLNNVKILGPVQAPIGRIRNQYLVQIHLKIPKKEINLKAFKEYLRSTKHTLLALPSFKSITMQFDVDPI